MKILRRMSNPIKIDLGSTYCKVWNTTILVDVEHACVTALCHSMGSLYDSDWNSN